MINLPEDKVIFNKRGLSKFQAFTESSNMSFLRYYVIKEECERSFFGKIWSLITKFKITTIWKPVKILKHEIHLVSGIFKINHKNQSDKNLQLVYNYIISDDKTKKYCYEEIITNKPIICKDEVELKKMSEMVLSKSKSYRREKRLDHILGK